MTEHAPAAGWLITGFQATIAIWAWVLLVLLHSIFRLWSRPEADPIRSSGPVE